MIREYFNRKTRRFEERRVSLRHDNKFVRRIFYRRDWNLGGDITAAGDNKSLLSYVKTF